MKNAKFSKIIQAIQKFRDERDWLQFHNPKDMAAALSIESSELQELFLWKSKKEIEEYVKDKNNIAEISDELGDIFSFAIELADNLGIDIEEAVLKKMEKSSKKYPVEKAKGRHAKYNKL